VKRDFNSLMMGTVNGGGMIPNSTCCVRSIAASRGQGSYIIDARTSASFIVGDFFTDAGLGQW
jgi:hypothetical protein